MTGLVPDFSAMLRAELDAAGGNPFAAVCRPRRVISADGTEFIGRVVVDEYTGPGYVHDGERWVAQS
ncbi:MAG: hypothetical protein EPO06_11725 [Burkholderiaceae bacterium]|nr:MAG: hypothetical protein EPO06_11725 [Burkholderiaceae bacterium]